MSYTNNTACQIRFGVWREWKGKKSREKNTNIGEGLHVRSAGQARENLTDLHGVAIYTIEEDLVM